MRVLFCITVYNGKQVVPRCLESALRLDHENNEVDILILDDASSEPGWSDELKILSTKNDIQYYRTPRNLGIPRNVNLGLLVAVEQDYDYVVICNSDVIFPRNLIPAMIKSAKNPGVGSVTAWSNNVSIYSIPNVNPDKFLANQDVVDWISAALDGEYSGSALDIPAGISFCMMIPTAVVRQVGLMDPVFGRGYCEETDWSLRSLAAGYRICLAPGTFVYHEGRGSNIQAGLVANNGTTVPENERIIDMRYPQFRDQVGAFLGSGLLQQAHHNSVSKIIRDAGQSYGYSVEIGWLPRVTKDEDFVRAHVLADDSGAAVVNLEFRGFREKMTCTEYDVASMLAKYFTQDPILVNMLDRGRISSRVRGLFNPESIRDVRNYPPRV